MKGLMICLGIAVVLIATAAQARTIHVEFSYPAATATGFRLYQNGVPVCEITDGAARQMDCDVAITYKDIFELTAVSGTTESARSLPYIIFRARALYRRMRGGAFSGGSM